MMHPSTGRQTVRNVTQICPSIGLPSDSGTCALQVEALLDAEPEAGFIRNSQILPPQPCLSQALTYPHQVSWYRQSLPWLITYRSLYHSLFFVFFSSTFSSFSGMRDFGSETSRPCQ